MATSRFTDIKKWDSDWFRTLPQKAKLAWIYLCDDCDHCGIWKTNYGTASFKLDFKVTEADLFQWFGEKLFSFESGSRLLVIPFFEFQYGKTKDTWSAKVSAIKTLESCGFIVENNKVQIPEEHSPPTVGTQSPQGGGSLLSIGIGKGTCKRKGGVGEKHAFDFEAVYRSYPRKDGKAKGLAAIKKQVTTQADFQAFEKAVASYAKYCLDEKKESKFIQFFSTFVGAADVQPWRDWIDYVPADTRTPEQIARDAKLAADAESKRIADEARKEMGFV